MERYIVERIEKGIVVLENEDLSHTEVLISEFSFSVKESDVILYDGERYFRDNESKSERKQTILNLQNKLKNRKEN